MANPRTFPAGEDDKPPVKPEPARPDEEAGEPSTGDMQEVGATEPEEVEPRKGEIEGEAPVHENPGDQNSG